MNRKSHPAVRPVKTCPDVCSTDKYILLLFAGLYGFSCLLNLGYNLIWTPNESFYAEAVREMLASGNYLDIFYNYEPRYNKPPLLYWLMAVSAQVFGISEYTLRLPSALAGLGTVLLTYRIGRELADRRTGVLAAAIVAFSFQFVINARYASPAVPLTFFFTLTVYWFLHGYHGRKRSFIWLAYLALGLTVLMKGYPYAIVISLIIGLYLLFRTDFRWRPFWSEVAWLRPWLGLPLALAIGMSWVGYMLLSHGDAFYEVFMNETYRRAFTREASPKPFYYLEANLWGFLPYALSFYAGLGYLVATRFRDLRKSPALQLGFSWFIVMLVVFTIAKGKIPTYFIQAHPGMAILTAVLLLRLRPQSRSGQVWYRLQFWVPGVLFSLLGGVLIYIFNGSPLLYPLTLLPILAWYGGRRYQLEYLSLPYFPFTTFLLAYSLFAGLALPHLEQFRHQDEIGAAICRAQLPSTAPVLVEERQFHNLPYYAGRRVTPYQSTEQIKEAITRGPALVLAAEPNRKRYPKGEELWSGYLFNDSETKTMVFLLESFKLQRGEESRFGHYILLRFGQLSSPSG